MEKRGEKSIHTTPVPRVNQGLKKATFLHPFNLMPFLVSAGLKSKNLDRDYDIYSIAENFIPDTSFESYENIIYSLYEFADCICIPGFNSGQIFSLISAGSHIFYDKYKEYVSFFEKQDVLYQKYKPTMGRLCQYLLAGKENSDWYQDASDAFYDLLPNHDIVLFKKVFALTSPRMDFKSNLVAALKAYDVYLSEKSFLNAGFLNNVSKMLEDFRNGNLVFKNPPRGGRRKVINFGMALLGDVDATVVDSWVLRAYGMSQDYIWKGKKIPYKINVMEYDFIEAHIKSLAIVSGYTPREIASILWSGARKTLGDKSRGEDPKTVLLEVLS